MTHETHPDAEPETDFLCQHRDWEHQALLSKVTVVIFTLRQPDELFRLVNSLDGCAVRVKVYDNGHDRSGAPPFEQSARLDYRAKLSPWSTMIESAAVDLETEFTCIVDDDALINLDALADAVCTLGQHTEWTSLECVPADMVVKNGVAFINYAHEPSAAALETDADPMSRFVTSMAQHSEAPFYGVHRSSFLSMALSTKAKVQAAARSTRNASTPIMIGMLSFQGLIGHCPLVLTIRELKHASIDQTAMNLWFGDWYFGSAYQSEVNEVRQIVVSAVMQLGFDERQGVRALAALDQHAAVHRHQAGQKPTYALRIIQKLLILTRRGNRRSATAPPELHPPKVLGRGEVSGVYGTSREPCWYDGDLSRLLQNVGASEVQVVTRPRDMPLPT